MMQVLEEKRKDKRKDVVEVVQTTETKIEVENIDDDAPPLGLRCTGNKAVLTAMGLAKKKRDDEKKAEERQRERERVAALGIQKTVKEKPRVKTMPKRQAMAKDKGEGAEELDGEEKGGAEKPPASTSKEGRRGRRA